MRHNVRPSRTRIITRTLTISALTLLACAATANANIERLILREIFPTYPAGIPADARTFHLFAEFSTPQFAVVVAGNQSGGSFSINSTAHPGAAIYQHVAGTFLPPVSALFEFVPELEFHSYVGIGLITDDPDMIGLMLAITTSTVTGEWNDGAPLDRQGEGVLNPASGKYETFLGQFTISGMTPGASPPDGNDLVDPASVFDGPLSLILSDPSHDLVTVDFPTFSSPPDDGGGGGTAEIERIALKEIETDYPGSIPANTRTFHLLAQFFGPQSVLGYARPDRFPGIEIDTTTHPGAEYYQHPAGGDLPPDPADFIANPGLEYDSYVGMGSDTLDPHVETSSTFEFDDRYFSGAWWDTDHTDALSQSVFNSDLNVYEVFLGQLTITGMAPGESPPDANGYVDPSTVFRRDEMALEMYDDDGALFSLTTRIAFPEALESCARGISEAPPSGVVFNDWIGIGGAADASDPASWSQGAPGPGQSLRFLPSGNFAPQLSSDVTVDSLAPRAFYSAPTVDMGGNTLTLTSDDDPISTLGFECDTFVTGSIGISNGELILPNASLRSIEGAITIFGGANASATALLVSGSPFFSRITVSDVGTKVVVPGGVGVSGGAKTIASLHILDGARVEGSSFSQFTARDSGIASLLIQGADSSLDVEGEFSAIAQSFSDGIGIRVRDGARIKSGAVDLKGAQYSVVALTGKGTEWVADGPFKAIELDLDMEDGATIASPSIELTNASPHTDTYAIFDGNLTTPLSLYGEYIVTGNIQDAVGLRPTLKPPASRARGAASPLFDVGGYIDLNNTGFFTSFEAGFTPALDDEFFILRAGTMLGDAFANTGLPDLPESLGWRITYLPNEVHLKVAPFCAGDADYSGAVTAADLATLIGSWGPTTSANEHLDTNGDNNIGAADLATLVGSWGACP